MELLLLSVTVVSLILALVMGVVAWRLGRDERARSAARVAALAAAASEPGSSREQETPRVQTTAWRGDESRAQAGGLPRPEPAAEWPLAVNDSKTAPWSTARVSAFPSESADRTNERRQDRYEQRAARASVSAAPNSVGNLFLGSAAAAPESGGGQRRLAIAACVLFVAALVGGYWTVYGDATSESAQATAAAARRASTPLELMSLRHERRGGRLSIGGLVRNPAEGAPVERLSAVVFLFDQQGGFITSARSDIDLTTLTPGDESPFIVALEAPPSVARYRVSFRTPQGVVPHVDRRGQEPIARELP